MEIRFATKDDLYGIAERTEDLTRRVRSFEWKVENHFRHARRRFANPRYIHLVAVEDEEIVGSTRTELKSRAGWTGSSFDALAANSLATYLTGFDINEAGYLNMLNENALGSLHPNDEIEIIGEKPKDLLLHLSPIAVLRNRGYGDSCRSYS